MKPPPQLITAWQHSGTPAKTTAAAIARRYQNKAAWTELPTANELSRELGVTYATIRRARQLLIQHKLIQPGADPRYYFTT
jgi:hypothetical protein